MIIGMGYHGENVFEGAAEFYAKYRPAYPPELFEDIAGFYKLDGRGVMLDLGCGTGELAIPLARYFEKVMAVDPDVNMLALGRQKAGRAKIDNIAWEKASSRSMTGRGGHFRLAALGQSLFWMDEKAILDKLYDRLVVGGGLVIAGTESAKQNKLAAKKDRIIKRLIAKYLGPKRRAGTGFYQPSRLNWENGLLLKSQFGAFEKRVYITKSTKNIDQILGNLFSMSWALKHYFGSRLDDFEAELRIELGSISCSGSFEEKVKFGAYFLHKK